MFNNMADILEQEHNAYHFLLQKLVVKDECSGWLRKNLKPDEYVFSSEEFDGFFGNRVNVSAIVGENGSGKSTLLELIFRMANNVGVMMAQRYDKPDKEPLLYFVNGIYADLYYSIDQVQCVLKSRGSAFGLEIGEKKVRFGGPPYHQDLDGFEDYNQVEEIDLKAISKYFFYTIVNNYSMQAYDSNDYKRDVCARMYRGASTYMDYRVSWINNAFHRNDGYTTPITLNPYRQNGILDMHNLSILTEQRLEALLVEFKSHKRSLLEGYDLRAVTYRIDKEKLVAGFGDAPDDYVDFPYVQQLEENRKTPPNIDLDKKLSRILGRLRNIYKNRDSYASVIMNRFRLLLDDNSDDLLWMAALYLVKKVLQIAVNYPNYEDFRHLAANGPLAIASRKEERQDVSRLVKHVKKDKSHIALKVRQTVRFVKQSKGKDLTSLKETFTYDDYVNVLWKGSLSVNSVRYRLQLMPPAFFSREIMMMEVKTGKTMPIGRMSSGERQFLYSFSTLIYHAINVFSVPVDDRIAYRNILLVLDEVEICFHPEYQREFVNKLLEMLKQSCLSALGSIYILVTTHSPFILSDIPKDNIIYLKDGEKAPSDSFINPFCANVNDILKQSFFLNKGFIGDFAQRKIKKLATFLSNFDGNRKANMAKAQRLINMVGDPVIKEKLQIMLDDVLERYPRYDNRERKLQRKAELLKQLKDLALEDGEDIGN